MYCRSTVNVLPFESTICDMLGTRMPDLHNPAVTDFNAITDQRCLDIWTRVGHRPWTVAWSGGIDSTAIVVSLLRNLRRDQLDQISIACNTASIYEYAWFYHHYIRPNFRTVPAYSILEPETVQGCVVINGNPADQMFPSGGILAMIQSGIDVDQNMFTYPDALIRYVADRTTDRAAKWLYDRVVASIRAQDLDLHTYSDMFWWAQFNFNWTGMLIKLAKKPWLDQGNLRPYLDTVVNWFDTPDYQRWAWQCRGRNIARHLGAYKQSIKDYIFDYTQDQYYWKFKTKTGSSSIRLPAGAGACVLSDWTVLSDQDIPKILDLLPAHLAA